jgi:hypothetical protein
VTLSDEEPTEDALKTVAAQKGHIRVLQCGANEKEKGGRYVDDAKPARAAVKSRNGSHAAPTQKKCTFGFTTSRQSAGGSAVIPHEICN